MEKIDKQIIENFLEELPSNLPVSNLVVVNLPRNVNIEGLLNEKQKNNSAFLKYKDEHTHTLINDLLENVGSKKLIFIEFVGYLPAELVNVFESISKNGWVDSNDESGKIVRHTLDQDSHVVLVSERKFIESQWGNLNNLTTYVLDLEN